MSNVDVPQIVELGTGLIGTIASFFNPVVGGVIVGGGKAVATGLRAGGIGVPDKPDGKRPVIEIGESALSAGEYYGITDGRSGGKPMVRQTLTDEDTSSGDADPPGDDDDAPKVEVSRQIFNLTAAQNPAGQGRGVDDPEPSPELDPERGMVDGPPAPELPGEPTARRARWLGGLFGRARA